MSSATNERAAADAGGLPPSPEPAPALKISEQINLAMSEKRQFFSFEYFPPKTQAASDNLFDRIHRMCQMGPLFTDVTWSSGARSNDPSFTVASKAQKLGGVPAQIHLTCTDMTVAEIKSSLEHAKALNIRNILALRGDKPGSETWQPVEGGFTHAIDLVKFIRAEYGDFFSVGVGAYPEGHPEAEGYDMDMRYLKEKVDAGADYIITNLFYDVDQYLQWVLDCRSAGITIPILPGIMPIHQYTSWVRITMGGQTKVPQHMLDSLEHCKNDDEKVKRLGIQLIVDMCRRLMESPDVPGLHFYTLNMEYSVREILKGVSLVREEQMRRNLSWQSCTAGAGAATQRKGETTRPIFWANRPKSYAARTQDWDEYPNGRWGDNRSPAFGTLNDYHLFRIHTRTKAERMGKWGECPTELQDVYDTFTHYVKGDIDFLPWSDKPLDLESGAIKDQLVAINKAGLLTINSQPPVNGCPSSHADFGWGADGGYCYQKEYFEFFACADVLHILAQTLQEYPSITYHASNRSGDSFSSNGGNAINAVTWGIFPNQEVQQPTVVDPESFIIWKDEAFALWTEHWGTLYPRGSPSRKLIDGIASEFYLINMVDNNFVNGDMSKVLDKVMVEMEKKQK